MNIRGNRSSMHEPHGPSEVENQEPQARYSCKSSWNRTGHCAVQPWRLGSTGSGGGAGPATVKGMLHHQPGPEMLASRHCAACTLMHRARWVQFFSLSMSHIQNGH